MNSTAAERSLVSDLVGRLEIRMLGLVLALGAALSILSPHFLTPNNLLNVLDQSVVVGIVAIGMTFVILIGGIDLSVGSVAGLTGVLLGCFDCSIRSSRLRRYSRCDGDRAEPRLYPFRSVGNC